MPGHKNYHKLSAMILLFVIAGLVAACGGAAEQAAIGETPGEPAEAAIEVPAGVLRAREAALAFVRVSANQCVPPEQAAWSDEAEPIPPAGYAVYRFRSDGCTMTITKAEIDTADMVYHVAVGDGPSGFCWQAVVDNRGNVLKTGIEAQTDPVLGNPAKKYCEERGYRFEIVDLATGGECGMCVFDDGRMCNSWAFFHTACTPENAPPLEQ